MHPIVLIKHLSDRQFHSGEELGERLGISRTAVWKLIQGLRSLGVDVQAVSGKGYRIYDMPELLSQELIQYALSPSASDAISRLDILPNVDSTNHFLLHAPERSSSGVTVVLAEAQTAGRGRRGKTWYSPFGRNIYLSMLYPTFTAQQAVEGLSLATAIAVLRCLKKLGARDLGIKWPNDILWKGRKLAGILVELAGEANGQYRVVIGVGINVQVDKHLANDIDQPWADLSMVMGAAKVSRNTLAAGLINELIDVLNAFQSKGLSHFEEEWRESDLLTGESVTIKQGDRLFHGTVKGIDESGALLVDIDGRAQLFFSGEVSVRANS